MQTNPKISMIACRNMSISRPDGTESKPDHQIALPNMRSTYTESAMDSESNHKDDDDDDEDERLDVVGTTDSQHNISHGKDLLIMDSSSNN